MTQATARQRFLDPVRGALAGIVLVAAVLSAGGAGAQTGARPGVVADPQIARIETYLNSLQSFKGRFLQIAPDGRIAEGQVFMRRPGRIRFQYEPPTPLLIVADGTWLVVWDKKLDQVDRVPLGSTPIGFLVAREVKLSGRIAVKSLRTEPGLIYLTAYDTERKDDGDITLVFGAEPLQLRQWIVTDPQNFETKVSLFDIETNLALDIRLFVFTDSGPSIP